MHFSATLLATPVFLGALLSGALAAPYNASASAPPTNMLSHASASAYNESTHPTTLIRQPKPTGTKVIVEGEDIEGTGTLTARSNAQPTCDMKAAGPANTWTLFIPNDKSKYDTSGRCGGGILDNLNGRCPGPSNYKCSYAPNGDDVQISFATSALCMTSDVQAVINAASFGDFANIECTENGNGQAPPEAGHIPAPDTGPPSVPK